MATSVNNIAEIIARDVKRRVEQDNSVLAQLILTNSRVLAPKKERVLANSGRVEKISGGHRIGYTAPYAWYQERGYTTGPVRRYTTAGTQAHYLETALKSALNSKGMRK